MPSAYTMSEQSQVLLHDHGSTFKLLYNLNPRGQSCVLSGQKFIQNWDSLLQEPKMRKEFHFWNSIIQNCTNFNYENYYS